MIPAEFTDGTCREVTQSEWSLLVAVRAAAVKAGIPIRSERLGAIMNDLLALVRSVERLSDQSPTASEEAK